jgi:hypothetical protein
MWKNEMFFLFTSHYIVERKFFDMLVEDQMFFLIEARRPPVIFLGAIFAI